MTVSQVADEVLYTGLIEMQELDVPGIGPGSAQARRQVTQESYGEFGAWRSS